MNTQYEKQPSKSSSCDASLNQSGVEKLQKISRYPQPEVEALKLHLNDKTDTICSDTWTCFQELGASAWQQSNWGEYRQLSLWKSTPTHSEFSDITFQTSQSTQTSETTIQSQESLKSSQWDGRVREHQTRELGQNSNIQLLLSGEKVSDALSKLNPASVFLSNLKEWSDEDLELFLPPYIWQDTVLKLKQSRRRSLEQDTRDSDYLSFPTLTSNVSSTSRPAGQTKCEKWFRDKGLIPNGSQLGSQAIAMIMGFPPNWFDCLSPTEPKEESKADTSQEEQLLQDKQRSLSDESSTSQKLLGGEKKLLEHKRCDPADVSSAPERAPRKRGERSSLSQRISIPCLVKQPKQPEVKGLIRKDEGDRFLVYVDGKEISVSKLYVYPDFSKSVGQIPPTKQASPPSKSSPTKTRRKKGDGTGYIYRRTVTRKGKQYQESYFRYRDESGKLKAKYIPQRLLSKVEEAESDKKPIADILFLLGGEEINRGEHSSTSKVPNNDESDQLNSLSRGEQPTPPSKRRSKGLASRREPGEGTGYIECKPIKRGGNEYKQYWYHYEEWREGDRLTKKSRYISKSWNSARCQE